MRIITANSIISEAGDLDTEGRELSQLTMLPVCLKIHVPPLCVSKQQNFILDLLLHVKLPKVCLYHLSLKTTRHGSLLGACFYKKIEYEIYSTQVWIS